MKNLQGEIFTTLKARYEQAFVNRESECYKECILTKRRFSDGEFATAYLWDCMENTRKQSLQYCLELLRRQENVYVLWDVFSKEQVWIPNYYKYPAESCLLNPGSMVEELLPALPEDVYFFDDSLSWTVVLTHEDDGKRRYCVTVNC